VQSGLQTEIPVEVVVVDVVIAAAQVVLVTRQQRHLHKVMQVDQHLIQTTMAVAVVVQAELG